MGVVAALIAWSVLITTYFALWNLVQIAMAPAAALFLARHQRRHTRRARALIGDLAAPPLVSVIVPAFNEALTIVESVRALLALDYEASEILIVNDGSTDGTLERLQETFHLVPAPVAFDSRHLPIYQRSRTRGARQEQWRLQSRCDQCRHQRGCRDAGPGD
jgi:cellulose synthase/poly-beta-1,6-N-acetylglucosamine synthase-like glycosyltransferase